MQAFKRDARTVGLGWKVEEGDALVLPVFSGATDLSHAQLPEGTDPFTGWSVVTP